jgi:hypothetical protein
VFAALRLNWNHLLQSVLRKKGLPVTADEYANADLSKAPFSSDEAPDVSKSEEEDSSDGQEPDTPVAPSEA